MLEPDELEVQELAPDDQGEPEQLEQEPTDASEEAPEPETEEVEVVSLDKEDPEESAPNWVKELRRKNREDAKKLRQLEEELARVRGGGQSEKPLTKPTLEQFDFDAEAFEKEMDDYYTKKAEVDRQQAQQRAAQEEVEREFNARQMAYTEGKKRYKPEVIQEAEAEVTSVLSHARQAMLLDAVDDPASLVAVLGSSPKTLREIAAIKSDARFIAKLVEVKMGIQSPTKKTPPPPERTISGSGKSATATSSNLDRLREEAQKSGDYSKYLAEKRRLGK